MSQHLPVNEIFDSIQGEGFFTGIPSSFIRLAGCNLSCSFCDTNFTSFTVQSVSEVLMNSFREHIIITGGEPFLAGDRLTELVWKLIRLGHVITIETNGSVEVPLSMMEFCDDSRAHSLNFSVSPKTVELDSFFYGNKRVTNLKILFPYIGDVTPEKFDGVFAEYRSIQPIMTETDRFEDLDGAIKEVCRLGSPWRLGPQVHKFLRVR